MSGPAERCPIGRRRTVKAAARGHDGVVIVSDGDFGAVANLKAASKTSSSAAC